MNFIRRIFDRVLTRIIVAIIIGFLASYGIASADIGDIDFTLVQSNTNNTGTVPGTIHRLYCPTYFTLERFGFHTRTNTGSVTFGFYFDGQHKASTTVTTTQSWFYTDVGLPCNKGYVDMQIFTSNGSNYYSYQPTYLIPNATTSGTYVQNQTSSLYNTFYAKFSLPLNITNSSSSDSMGTTTIVSQNDPLISFALIYFIFIATLIVVVGVVYPMIPRKSKEEKK